MTELRRRMIEDMELHGLTAGTQRTYLEAIKNLARHYSRPPDQISEQEIRDFIVYLTKTKRLGSSTVRVYVYAIKFLYKKTLNKQWRLLDLIRIKRTQKLPAVLTVQEVRHILNRVRRPAARMSLIMMYSCGLRVSEATGLQGSDIDSKRMVVCVRNGKGGKDRHVPLPSQTLEQLRVYWRKYRPKTWLFPSRNSLVPICSSSVLRCLKAALRKSDVTKDVTCHSLRHSYATHLLENGVSLRVIQALLGHKSPRTTFIYMHLTESTMKQVHDKVNELINNMTNS